MKKRLRLIFTTIALCASLALMVFGVYSATQVNSNLTGSIVYDIEDAFVQIQTKVYKSSSYMNSGQVGKMVNELAQSDFNNKPASLDDHVTSPIFKTTPSQQVQHKYGTEGELDLEFKNGDNPVYAYFMVVNIKNLSTENYAWAIVDDTVSDYVSNTYDNGVDDAETAALEIPNTVQVNNGAVSNIDTNGKNLVFALAVNDYKTEIENASFDYKINIGLGDLASQDFNMAKLSVPEGEDTVSASSTNIKGVVVLPNDVSTVADEGFYECAYLTTVIIPENITTIGTSAFDCCNSISTITIPNTVENLGSYAFCNCYSVTLIEYNAENADYYDDGDTWPFGYISESTNAGATVIFGESVETLPHQLLTGEEGLEYYYAIDVKSTHQIFGEDFFKYFIGNSLSKITVNKDNNYYSDGSLNGGQNCLVDTSNQTLLLGCSTSILPDTITSIGDYAFVSNDLLTELIIPSNVTSIGSNAFDNCTSLTSITIPDSVTSIGDAAFYSCTSLTNMTIPEKVTSIGSHAFDHCTSLTSIKIPEGVASIGYAAFSSCSSLTSIKIPDSVTSIGDAAFEYCTSLTSITIPERVTSIGDDAFQYCTSLTSITIPERVTSIGDDAFRSCTSLTSITIPDSVTSIGINAFFNCNALAHVYFLDTTSTWKVGNKTVSVGNSGNNATYLKTTYRSYTWTKNV